MTSAFWFVLFLEITVIGAGVIAHVKYIESGRPIFRKWKGLLALIELGFIFSILLGLGGFDLIIPALFLFPGLRWQRDYIVNILIGNDWDYVPPRGKPTTAWTDIFLSRFTPNQRDIIRIVSLVVSYLSSFIIINYE